jgi:TatA/E family protein of Tat protein translocase
VLNLDPAKLLIIAVVAVILLGPDKLPQVARQAGAAWRTFNDFRHRMESEVRSSIPDLPSSTDIARLARSPTALLNHLSNMVPDGAEGAANEAANGASEGAVDGAGAPGPNGNGTSADPTVPAESANGSANGNTAGHPSTISVPPTSTIPTAATPPIPPIPPIPPAPPNAAPSPSPATTPGPGLGLGLGQPVDPSLN